jgi:hypothetical protein
MHKADNIQISSKYHKNRTLNYNSGKLIVFESKSDQVYPKYIAKSSLLDRFHVKRTVFTLHFSPFGLKLFLFHCVSLQESNGY